MQSAPRMEKSIPARHRHDVETDDAVTRKKCDERSRRQERSERNLGESVEPFLNQSSQADQRSHESAQENNQDHLLPSE